MFLSNLVDGCLGEAIWNLRIAGITIGINHGARFVDSAGGVDGVRYVVEGLLIDGWGQYGDDVRVGVCYWCDAMAAI